MSKRLEQLQKKADIARAALRLTMTSKESSEDSIDEIVGEFESTHDSIDKVFSSKDAKVKGSTKKLLGDLKKILDDAKTSDKKQIKELTKRAEVIFQHASAKADSPEHQLISILASDTLVALSKIRKTYIDDAGDDSNVITNAIEGVLGKRLTSFAMGTPSSGKKTTKSRKRIRAELAEDEARADLQDEKDRLGDSSDSSGKSSSGDTPSEIAEDEREDERVLISQTNREIYTIDILEQVDKNVKLICDAMGLNPMYGAAGGAGGGGGVPNDAPDGGGGGWFDWILGGATGLWGLNQAKEFFAPILNVLGRPFGITQAPKIVDPLIDAVKLTTTTKPAVTTPVTGARPHTVPRPGGLGGAINVLDDAVDITDAVFDITRTGNQATRPIDVGAGR